MAYSLRLFFVASSIASVSSLFRRGDIALASSGGYSSGAVSLFVLLSRGTIIVPEDFLEDIGGRLRRRVRPLLEPSERLEPLEVSEAMAS